MGTNGQDDAGHSLVKSLSVAVPAIFGAGGARGAIMQGLEAFSASELHVEPPRLRIVHAMQRRDQGFPGQYRLGSALYDEVHAVFLKAHPGRALREGEGPASHVVCGSTTKREPHPSVGEPRDVYCGTCEYGQWTGEDKARIPPPCGEFVAFLGVLPEEDHKPFWFVCQKTARQPAMEYLQTINQLLMEGVPHLGCLLTKLSTAEKTGKGGGPNAMTWYEPVFTVIQRLDPAVYQEMANAVQQSSLEWLPRMTTQKAEVGTDATVPPVRSPGAEVQPPVGDVPF